MLRSFLIITLIFICSCQDASNSNSKKNSKQSSPAGNPILKDYVKVPLDKAKLAEKMNDRHNRKMDEQIKALDQ